MPKNRWVVVSTEGLDAEEVARPRTQELECPSCDRLVRFVEKELVRNLRVFGVPLVGVERGRRVLECPSCRACIEPPDGLAEGPDDAERQQLRAKVLEARDEHWLWQRRAEKCVERGDDELATEALRMAKRAAAELERLEAELNRGSRVTKGSEPRRAGADDEPPRARPVVVARPAPSGTGVVETHDDAFAALKAKVAKRAAEETARDQAGYAERMADIAEQEALRAREEAAARAEEDAARTELTKREAAPAPAAHDTTEDDFAALKAKLAGRAASTPARPAPADDDEEDETAALKAKLAGRAAPAPAAVAAAPALAAPSVDFGPSVPSMPAPMVPAMPAPEPAPAPAAPAPVTSVDDEFAALKARVASRAAATSAPEAPRDTSAYEALRREMSQPAPEPAPAVAPAPAPAAPASGDDDDDDPVAALKRKLRKK